MEFGGNCILFSSSINIHRITPNFILFGLLFFSEGVSHSHYFFVQVEEQTGGRDGELSPEFYALLRIYLIMI